MILPPKVGKDKGAEEKSPMHGREKDTCVCVAVFIFISVLIGSLSLADGLDSQEVLPSGYFCSSLPTRFVNVFIAFLTGYAEHLIILSDTKKLVKKCGQSK